jgi:hypothetical protein
MDRQPWTREDTAGCLWLLAFAVMILACASIWGAFVSLQRCAAS